MKATVLLFTVLAALPAAAQDFSNPRSLVTMAVDSHPAMARLRAESAAARERVAPAAALPNPMLMGGVQNKMIDFSDDEMMTMYMVGASQKLTRGSKRDAQRKLASAEAAAVDAQLGTLRAEIERDVLLAWYDLAAADEALATTKDVREMIDAIIAAARVRYEVGTSSQSDVIRAQLEQSALDHEILALRGARQAALARLLPLLGLPLATDVPPVKLPENTEDLTVGAATAPPPDHPALASLQAEVDAADARVEIARLDAKPDVDLEAQYGYRRMQRDMFSVVARIELPVRKNSTIEPRVREAIAAREAAKARIDELRLSLVQSMASAVAAHQEATSQLELHRDVLVPQAKLAFDSTLAAYQTGKTPFDAILTTGTDYLRLRLQYFDFLARHAQAVVTWEALLHGARSSSLGAGPSLSAGTSRSSSGSGAMSSM